MTPSPTVTEAMVEARDWIAKQVAQLSELPHRYAEEIAGLKKVSAALEAALAASIPQADVAEGRSPSYQQIIDLVNKCRVRQRSIGESDRMLARWISEELAALLFLPANATGVEVVAQAEEILACLVQPNPSGDGLWFIDPAKYLRFANAIEPLRSALAAPVLDARREALGVDALAQEIRRVDGNNALGAGALAEALMPFVRNLSGQPK